MKTVVVVRQHDYTPHPCRTFRFFAGVVYARVIDAAAQSIERAGAGHIVADSPELQTTDAGHAWKRRK